MWLLLGDSPLSESRYARSEATRCVAAITLHIFMCGVNAIRVLARVGHGKHASALVLQLEVLVLELLAVDGLAASAIITHIPPYWPRNAWPLTE